jgi:hypothetical protein
MNDRSSRSPRAVLMSGSAAALVWIALAAPQIERSISMAELGPWRDIRLAIVRPLADARAIATSPAAVPTTVATSLPLAPVVAGVQATPEPARTRPPRVPNTADPLRVLVIGDSLAGDLGRSLGRITAPSGLVAVDLDYKPASGLSRPDYFDWAAALANDIARLDPEIVVVMLGGNDAQSFEANGHVVDQGTAEWRSVYAERAAALMAVATVKGRRAIWVGLPVMADPSFGELMRRQNDIYRAAAAAVVGVTYLDTWSLFADPSGRYAAYLPDASGRPTPMRQADGIHLSIAGAERLANVVMSELRRENGL